MLQKGYNPWTSRNQFQILRGSERALHSKRMITGRGNHGVLKCVETHSLFTPYIAGSGKDRMEAWNEWEVKTLNLIHD